MVLAQLAARLHERRCRQPARACTSLELLDLPQLGEQGAMLFSSSAKHPDARKVLQEFRRKRFSPAAVFTHRRAENLLEVAGPDTQVVELPPLAQPDGFLATGSVIQIAVVLLRAFLGRPQLPGQIGSDSSVAALRDEVLVLTEPSLLSVATDIEVRLVESGLAAVQVADFRNFAHGRHTGFARRLDRVSVIVLSDSGSEALATATAEVLPPTADVRRWHEDGPWPTALVNLLVRSMQFAGQVGAEHGLDPARPSVPEFGRKLYRLPLGGGRLPDQVAGGIERKVLALGSGDSVAARAFFLEAAAEWSSQLTSQRFRGVVLDYDGTVCWTHRRFDLPSEGLQQALRGLLESRMILGFASGRGKSLHADLRRWIPETDWPNVIVGMYNGAVQISLDQSLPDLRAPSPWSGAVMSALQKLPLCDRLDIEERGAQVKVEPRDGILDRGVFVEALRACFEDAKIEAQVVASGHSVDVISTETSKTTIIDAVGSACGGADSVLAIGDQGQVGGNDHALLAFSPWSLTVDRGSADPTRCWFAGSGEKVGPDLLLRYLKSLQRRRGGFALKGLKLQ